MNIPQSGVEYWLVSGATDMRQGRFKLAEFVRSQLGGGTLCNHWFIFCSAAEDQLRILWWDKKGDLHIHCQYTSHGRFIWPQEPAGSIPLSRAQVKLLFAGADWTAENTMWAAA